LKASAPPVPDASVNAKTGVSTFLDLIKARLTSLVLLTHGVGFYMGSQGTVDYVLMLHALLGTGLVACGAAALNQLVEREHDARMPRTQARPLPSGRMNPEVALLFGGVAASVGLIYLALAVNLLTSFLAAMTLASYVWVYTPLKRVTPLNTIIGAIPGALPPLMGWTAARGEVSAAGWALFAILFFWQLPHFYAIGWLYREEYERAGFRILPVSDPDGHRTARQTISHTLGLLPVSLTPFLLHVTGEFYVVGALVLGGAFLWNAIQFSRHLTKQKARQLFLASVIYLPLLLGLMVLNKVN